MGKRRPKRLFPKNMQATSVRVPRVDANKAAAYNAQRTKATQGPRSNSEHIPDNSFTQPIPETKKSRAIAPWWEVMDLDEKKNERRRLKDTPKVKQFQGPPRDKVVADKHGLMVVDTRHEMKDTVFFYRVWQSKDKQGVQEYFRRVLDETPGQYCLSLFFSAGEYFFVQEVFFKNTRRISAMYTDMSTYHSKVRTMEINWVKVERIIKE